MIFRMTSFWNWNWKEEEEVRRTIATITKFESEAKGGRQSRGEVLCFVDLNLMVVSGHGFLAMFITHRVLSLSSRRGNASATCVLEPSKIKSNCCLRSRNKFAARFFFFFRFSFRFAQLAIATTFFSFLFFILPETIKTVFALPCHFNVLWFS